MVPEHSGVCICLRVHMHTHCCRIVQDLVPRHECTVAVHHATPGMSAAGKEWCSRQRDAAQLTELPCLTATQAGTILAGLCQCGPRIGTCYALTGSRFWSWSSQASSLHLHTVQLSPVRLLMRVHLRPPVAGIICRSCWPWMGAVCQCVSLTLGHQCEQLTAKYAEGSLHPASQPISARGKQVGQRRFKARAWNSGARARGRLLGALRARAGRCRC